MAYAELTKEREQINDGLDSIVIVKDLGDIPGGVTLDVTGLTGVVKAGHIIKKTATGYAPLGVSGSPLAYVSLSAWESYAGVLKHTISVDDPRAAVLTIGQINGSAIPYAVDAKIKAGLPMVQFI